MDKVLEVQRDVRQNAGEMQDFLKDLDSWAQEMQLKDEQLKAAKQKARDTVKPPTGEKPKESQVVRLQHKEIKKKVELAPSPPKKEKIRGNDYDQWDKFDVEEECRKIDEGEGSEDESEEDEEEEMEDERLKQQAVAERERGNSFFKAANYVKAIEKYTAGMQCDPLCPMLPANRAMALLKTGQYGAAERDATISLSLDPTYIKAYQRRASARIGLSKFEEAMADYQKVLELEPSNKAARLELEKLREKCAAAAQIPQTVEEEKPVAKLDLKANISKMFAPSESAKKIEQTHSEPAILDPLLVLPVAKPPHLRSKKPLRRIQVVDTAEDLVTHLKENNTVAAQNTKLIETEKEVSITVLPEGAKKASRIIIEEVDSSNKDEHHYGEQKFTEAVQQPSSTSAGSRSRGLGRKVEAELQAATASSGAVGSIPPLPSTFAQFTKDWRTLHTAEQRLKFVSQFGETSYRTVFKSSLESQHFTQIVEAWHLGTTSGEFSPQQMADHLRGILQLSRISAVAMFLSKPEMQLLQEVRAYAAPSLSEADMAKLKQILGV